MCSLFHSHSLSFLALFYWVSVTRWSFGLIPITNIPWPIHDTKEICLNWLRKQTDLIAWSGIWFSLFQAGFWVKGKLLPNFDETWVEPCLWLLLLRLVIYCKDGIMRLSQVISCLRPFLKTKMLFEFLFRSKSWFFRLKGLSWFSGFVFYTNWICFWLLVFLLHFKILNFFSLGKHKRLSY